MPPLGRQGGGCAGGVDRLLLLSDRGGGLERHPQGDRLPIADAALDAARVVGGGAQAAILAGQEGIVVFAAQQQRATEPRADLEALGGRQRHHRLGQVGLELVEHRHPEPHRWPPHQAFDHATAGIAFPANRLNPLNHPLGHSAIGTAHDVGFHRLQAHRGRINGGLDRVDAPHPGDHLGAGHVGEQLLGDRAGRHAPDRFTGGGPATAAAGLDAVFRLIGGIGVGGTKGHLHLAVILGPLVLVAHHHCDRRAKGEAVEQATEDLDAIVLLAGGGDLALSGLAAVELGLDGLLIQGQSGRAAIHDHPHPAAVGFAEGADAEKLAEAAAHGKRLRGWSLQASSRDQPIDRLLEGLGKPPVATAPQAAIGGVS